MLNKSKRLISKNKMKINKKTIDRKINFSESENYLLDKLSMEVAEKIERQGYTVAREKVLYSKKAKFLDFLSGDFELKRFKSISGKLPLNSRVTILKPESTEYIIGVLMLNYSGANFKKNWILNVYGKDYLTMLRQSIPNISREYNVNLEIILESETPMIRTYCII